MTDDFSKEPISLNEVRAEKHDSGAYWTPRDTLISILRDIDSGNRAPIDLFIAFREKSGDGYLTGFYSAGTDGATILGMLEIAKKKFLMTVQ